MGLQQAGKRAHSFPPESFGTGEGDFGLACYVSSSRCILTEDNRGGVRPQLAAEEQ